LRQNEAKSVILESEILFRGEKQVFTPVTLSRKSGGFLILPQEEGVIEGGVFEGIGFSDTCLLIAGFHPRACQSPL